MRDGGVGPESPGYDRVGEKVELRFSSPGSLQRPGPIGRTFRFVVGVWLIYTLLLLSRSVPTFVAAGSLPRDVGFWLYVLIAFHVTPYVVNIGFGRNWRYGAQLFLAVATLGLLAADWLVYGRVWAPPLGVFIWAWLVYFSLHLGGSFVLSALLATPGCEMRALSHAWGRLRGRGVMEHYCPGPFDGLDRWEAEG